MHAIVMITHTNYMYIVNIVSETDTFEWFVLELLLNNHSCHEKSDHVWSLIIQPFLQCIHLHVHMSYTLCLWWPSTCRVEYCASVILLMYDTSVGFCAKFQRITCTIIKKMIVRGGYI